MALLGVCAFCLPYMPGNPPFPMPNWHLAPLTAHVALASLLALKRSFVEAGPRQFVSPKVVCVMVIKCYGVENLHLGAPTSRGI